MTINLFYYLFVNKKFLVSWGRLVDLYLILVVFWVLMLEAPVGICCYSGVIH